jgi:hypothetical protein
MGVGVQVPPPTPAISTNRFRSPTCCRATLVFGAPGASVIGVDVGRDLSELFGQFELDEACLLNGEEVSGDVVAR